MTNKIYRTSRGKVVDLGKLMLQNEQVRAVGNMSVNARGDLLDADNRVIDKRTQQVNRQYKRQVGNVRDEPVNSTDPARANKAKNIEPATSTKTTTAVKPVVNPPPPPEDFEDDFVKPPEDTLPPATGLAAAIARARQLREQNKEND